MRNQAPAECDRRYWDLLEAAPDRKLEVAENGEIVLSNAVAATIFGYDRAELTGKVIEDLVPANYRAIHTGHRAGYWAHPQTRPMGSGLCLSGLRKDGTEFPVEIGLSPVAYPEGHRVIAIIRDVTERRRAEERIGAVREQYTAELALKYGYAFCWHGSVSCRCLCTPRHRKQRNRAIYEWFGAANSYDCVISRSRDRGA